MVEPPGASGARRVARVVVEHRTLRGDRLSHGGRRIQRHLAAKRPPAFSPRVWVHCCPVRSGSGKHSSQGDRPTVFRDRLQVEVDGKPSMYSQAQESRAPKGVHLSKAAGDLDQYIEMQRHAEQRFVEQRLASRRAEVRAFIRRVMIILVLLALAAVIVLYAHPS